MAFDPIDAAPLRAIGFVVGTDSAIRIKFSVTYILWDDGRWYASHFRNNIRLQGAMPTPLAAYKEAKRQLTLALWNAGGPHARKQAV